MEDPVLPVPRFTPTVRKFRPQPIDVTEGLKKVKVEKAILFLAVAFSPVCLSCKPVCFPFQVIESRDWACL